MSYTARNPLMDIEGERAAESQTASEPKDGIILSLSNCVIRKYRLTDAPDVSKAGNSLGVTAYLTHAFPSPYTVEKAEGWIETANKEPWSHFAIYTTDTDMVVGGCGLTFGKDVESCTKILGYWLSPAAWGKGIMTDVVLNLSAWAFEKYPDMLRLEASVFHENLGSIRVLKKAGYQYEGTRRHAALKEGKVIDIEMYGLTREDYAKLKT